jgi:hypothetical protein
MSRRTTNPRPRAIEYFNAPDADPRPQSVPLQRVTFQDPQDPPVHQDHFQDLCFQAQDPQVLSGHRRRHTTDDVEFPPSTRRRRMTTRLIADNNHLPVLFGDPTSTGSLQQNLPLRSTTLSDPTTRPVRREHHPITARTHVERRYPRPVRRLSAPSTANADTGFQEFFP